MQLIRNLDRIRAPAPPTALAVGNFDGLHLGHQALIEAVRHAGKGLRRGLMCFEPLPASFFQPAHPVRRLQTVRDKLIECGRQGLDLVLMPRFDRRFASQAPEAFVERALVAAAGARHLVVGADFRFGARAAGDVELLHQLGRHHGFTVDVVPAVCIDGERISSSAVREHLAAGDLERASRLLGRAYAISGRVLAGQQLGRELGFPTANLRPPVPPALHGVLAVRVDGAGLDRHPGVASLGLRPTVNGKQWLLEVHLFDYHGDLYGQHLTVEFVKYLRTEQRFDGLVAMQQQMKIDAEQARAALNH